MKVFKGCWKYFFRVAIFLFLFGLNEIVKINNLLIISDWRRLPVENIFEGVATYFNSFDSIMILHYLKLMKFKEK